jgi:hypothetical protein
MLLKAHFGGAIAALYHHLQDECSVIFGSNSESLCTRPWPVSDVREISAFNIPCLGLPQTGHGSDFKVISAPEHEQKAATSIDSQL